MKDHIGGKKWLRSAMMIAGLLALAPIPASSQSLTPLYYWFYPGNGDNFYTITTDSLGGGWQFREVTAYVYDGQASGTIPLHRFYHPAGGDHFYTTQSSSIGGGWIYEGPCCYVLATQAVGSVPLRRWYNTVTGRHYYTASLSPPAGGGWVFEGNEGYVSPPE